MRSNQTSGRQQETLLIFSTAGSLEEGRRLAQILLKERVAACINILPRNESWYWWKKKVERGKEALLIIKSSRSKIRRLESLLKQHHSYEVPELVALPVRWGSPAYLRWLQGELG